MAGELSWTDLAGPLVLFFMMAVVGLGLTVEDFRRVGRYPRVVVAGTLSQWILLPAVSTVLLLLLELPAHVAAGLVLLVATPGGGSSNVMAYLAGAHTALSVSLTAVTSLLAAITLPLLTAGGFAFLGLEGIDDVPVAAMIGQLVLFVLVPVALGMWIHTRRPELAERYAAPLRRAVIVALVLLLAAGIGSDQTGLVGDLVHTLPAAALWTVAAFAAGWATGMALGVDIVDRFTLAIEFSVKNVGLAAIVALTGFHEPKLAVFAGAYVAIGYPMAAVASLIFRRWVRPGVPAAHGVEGRPAAE